MNGHQVAVLLGDLVVILAAVRLFGALARRCGQPPVIGEILAGLLLGPTLFDGALSDALFPPDVRPMLGALANVGVALFMVLVGLELDRKLLRGVVRVAATVAVCSIAVPFALGTLLALYLAVDRPGGASPEFVLFMGTAMALTAFPVLARILKDRRMAGTAVGGLALASAAICDVLAWLMLAGVVAFAGQGARWQLLLLLPYAVVMTWVVRPLLRRWANLPGNNPAALLAIVLVGALASGAATEWMGLHFIFGAFLFGVVVPREVGDDLRGEVTRRLEPVTTGLLVPVYFVMAGLQVDFSEVGLDGVGDLAAVLAVAVGGKFFGVLLAARVQGIGLQESLVLGTLMNVRGLAELVVLDVGLRLGLIDVGTYSLMVAMTLVTTAMAAPLLGLLERRGAPAGAVHDLRDR